MANNRSLAQLYKIINRKTLPPDLQNYYERNSGETFDLVSDIDELESLLIRYESSTEVEKKNTYIFLAVLGLFSGKYDLSLHFIRKLESIPLEEIERGLVMEIKYSIRKLDKIVILTSFDKATPLNAIKNYLEVMRTKKQIPKSDKSLIVRDVSSLTDNDLRTYFRKYEQVFLVGHGNDTSIEIGERSIGVQDIVSKLKGVFDKPSVLGIFSCGEAFSTDEIWNNVDYFITDSFSSSASFAEMFLLGYISSYYRNKDVLKAFDAGWILPTINAVDDPSFRLREKGFPIKP